MDIENYLLNEENNNVKNLIICRADDCSVHENWLYPIEYRNFDLAISYYGDEENLFSDDCVYYEKVKGTKFPAIYSLISNNVELISRYDSIWLADDDILTDAKTINEMFNIFNDKKMWLAQPSLTANSFCNHPITKQKEGDIFRYTNFVEIMTPIFSKEALFRCLYSFSESISGWGLDLVWPKILGNPNDKIAIIDAVSVQHTRKQGSGLLYRQIKINPWIEMNNIAKKYEVNLPYAMKTYKEYFE